MSIEQTRHTLTTYLDELLSFGDFAHCFTQDVTVTFMGTDRVITGRDAARTAITAMHQQAFRSQIITRAILCGDTNAIVEARFKGIHIGEFEAIPASGRQVDVSYVVAYDLRDDRICALRLYFPLDLLLRQITGAAQPLVDAL